MVQSREDVRVDGGTGTFRDREGGSASGDPDSGRRLSRESQSDLFRHLRVDLGDATGLLFGAGTLREVLPGLDTLAFVFDDRPVAEAVDSTLGAVVLRAAVQPATHHAPDGTWPVLLLSARP